MTALTCKTNPLLFGHGQAMRRFMEDLRHGRLAHGWIISGPKGIGKATFAYRVARAVLAGQGDGELSPEDSVFKRIATGAHADFLLVEPEYDEKKGEQKTQISVEQAREVAQFLSLTPAESAWRVVIIDSVDALNVNAANAILKILEEPPPQTLLLLISHNPGLLLPTIRSRCAQLKLAPLSGEDFTHTMQHLYPDMDEERARALEIFSAGAPGMAAQYEAQDTLGMYGKLIDIMAGLPEPDPLKVHAFAETFGDKKRHAQFQLFSDLVLCLLARASKAASGASLTPVSEEEQEVLMKLASLQSPARWALTWQQAQEQFYLAMARHLDYKQVVIVFFHSIATNDPFVLGTAA